MKNLYKKLSLLALLCVASVPCARAMDTNRSSSWLKAGLAFGAGAVSLAYCWLKKPSRSGSIGGSVAQETEQKEGSVAEEPTIEQETQLIDSPHEEGPAIEDLKQEEEPEEPEPEKTFLWAARDGDLQAVKWWINHGADLDQADGSGHTALHLAVMSGHADVVRYLVQECGVDSNQENGRGGTALHWAATFNRADVVRCLVEECGADANREDNNGMTAMRLAGCFYHVDVIRCLIDVGCSISRADYAQYPQEVQRLVRAALIEKNRPQELKDFVDNRMRPYLQALQFAQLCEVRSVVGQVTPEEGGRLTDALRATLSAGSEEEVRARCAQMGLANLPEEVLVIVAYWAIKDEVAAEVDRLAQDPVYGEQFLDD